MAELALLVALTVALYFLVVSGLGGELGRAIGAVVQVPTFA